MKQKKVAWLLALALTVTSIDGTAWAVKAEDFADDAEENVEVVQNSGQEETAVSDEQETVKNVTNEDNTEESAIKDSTEELSDESDNNEKATEDFEELSADEDEFSDGENLGSEAALPETELDRDVAEYAQQLEYKEFENLNGNSVVKFQVPKTGQYHLIGEETRRISLTYYNSDLKKCKTEETNFGEEVLTCLAGETYYAVLNSGYGSVAVYPIVTEVTEVSLPKQYHALWDGSVTVRSVGTKITYKLSDGKTEDYSLHYEDDRNLGVIDENNNWTRNITKAGTYKYRLKPGSTYYTFPDLGSITVQTPEDYAASMKSQELKAGEDKVTTGDDQLFRFVPEKDGQYRITSYDDGSEAVGIIFMDENKKIIDQYPGAIVSDLKAGKTYYYMVRGYLVADYDSDVMSSSGNEFTTNISRYKSIDSVTVDKPEYFYSLEENTFGYAEAVLYNVYITVTYDDGTKEQICLGSEDNATSQGDTAEADASGVRVSNGKVEKGEYIIPIKVRDKKTEVKVVIDHISDYYAKKATVVTTDKMVTIDAASTKNNPYYIFTAPEDSYYRFEDSSDNKQGTYMSYMDAEGKPVKKEIQLKAGQSVYIKAQAYRETGISLTAKKVPYILQRIELDESSDLTYREGIDFRYRYGEDFYTEDVNPENIKIKAVYTDGHTEELKGGEKNEEGDEVKYSYNKYDYDEDYNYLGERITVSLGECSIKVKPTIISFYDYFSKLDKKNVETIERESNKIINWNAGKGCLYKFIPSESGKYICEVKSADDSKKIRVQGVMFEENWYTVDEDYSDIDSGNLKLTDELQAGKTYYYLVKPIDNVSGQSILKIKKEGDKDQINIKLDNESATYEYTGTEIKPQITVTSGEKTLTEGTDYQVKYNNNINAGNASMEITPVAGKTDFEKKTISFVINPQSIEKVSVSKISDQVYTGSPQTPVIKLMSGNYELKAAADYEASYENNTEVGTATVKIQGKGNYTGTVTIPFQIVNDEKDFAKAQISGINKSYIYTGKQICPSVAVKYDEKILKEGTDYKVTYTANINAGKATVNITGTGKYKGEKTLTFQINNKIIYNLNGGTQNKNNKTVFCRQTVKLYNPTRKGYTFGGWYTDKTLKKKLTSISSKTTKNVTVYAKWTKVSPCSAPSKVTLKNTKAKTMTVSWSAVSGAKGYEISYATNAKFTKAVKKAQTGRSLNITKLGKGKTYYVRVRAYKTDSTGAKIYGRYSKTMKIRIAK